MYNSAVKVLEKLENFGYKAYIVGGYPRDLYLKRTSSDIDICTDATPKEIMNIFGVQPLKLMAMNVMITLGKMKLVMMGYIYTKIKKKEKLDT